MAGPPQKRLLSGQKGLRQAPGRLPRFAADTPLGRLVPGLSSPDFERSLDPFWALQQLLQDKSSAQPNLPTILATLRHRRANGVLRANFAVALQKVPNNPQVAEALLATASDRSTAGSVRAAALDTLSYFRAKAPPNIAAIAAKAEPVAIAILEQRKPAPRKIRFKAVGFLWSSRSPHAVRTLAALVTPDKRGRVKETDRDIREHALAALGYFADVAKNTPVGRLAERTLISLSRLRTTKGISLPAWNVYYEAGVQLRWARSGHYSR